MFSGLMTLKRSTGQSMEDQPCTTQLLSRFISHTQPHLYLLHSGKRTFGGNDFRGKWSSGENIYYPKYVIIESQSAFLVIFKLVHIHFVIIFISKKSPRDITCYQSPSVPWTESVPLSRDYENSVVSN